jgi:hypothetical protein
MVSPVGRDTPRDDTSTPRRCCRRRPRRRFDAELARRDQVAGDAVDGRLVDAEGVAARRGFAGELDHHATIDRLSHDAIAFLPARRRRRIRAGRSSGGGTSCRWRRDFGGEIGFLLLDSLAESIAHKSGDLHRRADLALSFLHRLGDRLAGFVVDEGLLQQADFLVVGLQAGLDDLLDHVLGLALLAILVGQHVLFALDDGGIEPGRIERLRIGRGDMHRELAAEARARRSCRSIRAPRSRPSCRRRRSRRCGRSSTPRPCRPTSEAARRSVMFSPMVAIASAIAVSTVTSPTLAALIFSTSAPTSSATCAIILTRPWNCSLRATKSVSELTSTTTPLVPLRSDARRSGLPRRRGRPSWRPSTGPSCAASRSPPHVAVGLGERLLAIHHAAPVVSRRSLTIAAVIVAIVESFACQGERGAA